ncbi:uncharacterized protein LOC107268453 isoform X2 [Cephus cinctus]|nr:uncharacterized protein LOC107268453 isoform X3 [Cephus cinctus]XP_024941513.1 uncharacterized protein LOC107268453 isoform X2 [Cephus cinctus]
MAIHGQCRTHANICIYEQEEVIAGCRRYDEKGYCKSSRKKEKYINYLPSFFSCSFSPCQKDLKLYPMRLRLVEDSSSSSRILMRTAATPLNQRTELTRHSRDTIVLIIEIFFDQNGNISAIVSHQ